MSNIPEHVQTTERGLVRQTSSHALINTDKSALTRNREARARAREYIRTQQEVRDLRAFAATLESRLAELTTLVNTAVDSIKR